LYDVDGSIARVTINRPERRNAMSFDVMQGLIGAFTEARRDVAVRVVVLSGAGDRAFCAGADLGSIADNASFAEVHEARGRVAELFETMWAVGKPTVARVRGYALAGGFGLACACDLVIAADDAVFGTPEIDIGLWPYMISVPLLRTMPPKKVLELMMTGRRIDAVEAERLGVVNRVVPVAELDTAVDDLATTLAAKPPLAMRWGRESFYEVLGQPDAHAALAYLHTMLTVTANTEDAAEGTTAFAEKRPPRWTGR
jgi:enoyl-CoA hydratase/carnithine racemase